MNLQFKEYFILEKYLPILKKLSIDEHIPKLSTNLVYLTASSSHSKLEKTIIDSILHIGMPKRADIYWFVHINVTDEPHTLSYRIDTIVKNDVYFIEFNLGFRIDPRINYYFKQVVKEMIQSKEVDISTSCELYYQQSEIGDYKFVTMGSFLSFDNEIPFWKNFIMKSFYNLKYLAVKEYINFGLDKNNLVVEKYPLVVVPFVDNKLIRQE